MLPSSLHASMASIPPARREEQADGPGSFYSGNVSCEKLKSLGVCLESTWLEYQPDLKNITNTLMA